MSLRLRLGNRKRPRLLDQSTLSFFTAFFYVSSDMTIEWRKNYIDLAAIRFLTASAFRKRLPPKPCCIDLTLLYSIADIAHQNTRRHLSLKKLFLLEIDVAVNNVEKNLTRLKINVWKFWKIVLFNESLKPSSPLMSVTIKCLLVSTSSDFVGVGGGFVDSAESLAFFLFFFIFSLFRDFEDHFIFFSVFIFFTT